MRSKMPLMGLVVVPVLTLAVAAPVLSQEQPAPLTWVAYTRVKPGKTQDWVKTGLKYDKPILDALVADGSVQSWGYAVRATHRRATSGTSSPGSRPRTGRESASG